MFYNSHSFIISSHIREKIYKGLNYVYSRYNSKRFPCFFNIDSLKVNFSFKNYFLNKIIFNIFLLLIEKLTLVNFKFFKAKKTISNFNIKKGLILGASYHLRSFKKDRFMHMFINYTLKKLNTNIVISIENILNKKLSNNYSILNNLYNFIYKTDIISFGIRKFLFHGIFVSSDIDYTFFLPLLQDNLNGIDIHLNFIYNHFLINRLILSHNNINIYTNVK